MGGIPASAQTWVRRRFVGSPEQGLTCSAPSQFLFFSLLLLLDARMAFVQIGGALPWVGSDVPPHAGAWLKPCPVLGTCWSPSAGLPTSATG